MVKYGKLYRELHLAEFKDNYIDYKKLKQKIKSIQNTLPNLHNNSINITMTSSSNLKIRTTITSEEDES